MAVLGVAKGGETTVFRLHGFGALGPFSTDQHLATLGATLHAESDDIVASSSNSDATDKFYRKDFASATVLDPLRKRAHESGDPCHPVHHVFACGRSTRKRTVHEPQPVRDRPQ